VKRARKPFKERPGGMCGKEPYTSRQAARRAARAAQEAALRRGERARPDIHGCSRGCPPGTWHMTYGRPKRTTRPAG
jgi:hypothetical protein